MGIDYKPLFYLGKVFEDAKSAEDFIKDSRVLNDKELDKLYKYGITEFLEEYPHLEGETIDCWKGQGVVLGYDLEPYLNEPQSYLYAYNEAMKAWKELFHDFEPEIIHEVKVW